MNKLYYLDRDDLDKLEHGEDITIIDTDGTEVRLRMVEKDIYYTGGDNEQKIPE
jgi:hypothetical protein